MNTLKLISLLVAISSCVVSHAQNDYSAKEIQNILQETGISANINDIHTAYVSPEIIVVKGKRPTYFAIIATKAFAQYVPHPVLAYSSESSLTGRNDSFQSMLQGYQSHLRHLYENKDTLHFKYPTDNILPLMAEIKWGQKHPYNIHFPSAFNGKDSVQTVVGCGPVAVGQILRYLGHPDADDPARLLISLANAMKARFGLNSTSTNIRNIRPTLTRKYGISPRCVSLKIGKESDLDLLYNEIREGRPVVLNGHNHFFICDGFKNQYLHLNFGWYGQCDGYYTLPQPTFPSADGRLFEYMTIGIEPDRDPELSRTIHIDSAGSLDSMLSHNERLHLHSLTITGVINGRDIRTLRLMAGALVDTDDISSRGSLEFLDLTGATIIDDTDTAYLTVDAGKARFCVWKEVPVRGIGSHRIEHHFENITDEDWAEVIAYKMHIGKGYRIRKENSTYLVDYFTTSKTIGEVMFAECSNLKEIRLPENTRDIRKNAFINTDLKQDIASPNLYRISE